MSILLIDSNFDDWCLMLDANLPLPIDDKPNKIRNMLDFFTKLFNKKSSQPIQIVQDATSFRPTDTKFVTLIILDGLGISHDPYGNAVMTSLTPNLDTYWSKGKCTLLTSSGASVGLPETDPGNSEVGHLLIGGGRVIFQSLELINDQLVSGNFRNNTEFVNMVKYVKANRKNLHLMGILSAGGVHGHISHLFSLLDICKAEGVNPLIHVFLDGRDTGPTDGYFYLSKLNKKIKDVGIGSIASISGRYFAMDRDYRWDRTFRAYNAIIGNGERTSKDIFTIIQTAYSGGETDESFIPTTMLAPNGQAVGAVQDGDAVLNWNYREDRSRQITKAFYEGDLPGPERKIFVPNLYVTTMRGYTEATPVHVLFAPTQIKDSLSEVISNNGFSQLHIAESEKYAHVTYFFNGGIEKPFIGESVQIVQSPKVADYTETPEMSAQLINDQIMYTLNNYPKNSYKLIVINYANADMLAHTGDYKKTVEAIQFLDKCVGEIVTKTVKLGGCAIITADHGNSESLLDKSTGDVDTKHNSNPVPFILINKEEQLTIKTSDVLYKLGEGPRGESTGILADVAPSILYLLNIPKPDTMTGMSLVQSV
jgi:2,3-bisphosphoglycerate-independent phosphoglycerate mutase